MPFCCFTAVHFDRGFVIVITVEKLAAIGQHKQAGENVSSKELPQCYFYHMPFILTYG